MSAQEIIEQIKVLPRNEQQEISEFVHSLQRDAAASAAQEAPGEKLSFRAALAETVHEHRDLLHRLAQ